MSAQKKWPWALGAVAVGAGLVAFGVLLQYVLIGAVLLLCPAMMLFMGGHDADDASRKGKTPVSSDMPVDTAGKETKPR